jgi:uncharacterized protein
MDGRTFSPNVIWRESAAHLLVERYRSVMPYATRTMHDADSHIYEDFDWLAPYLPQSANAAVPRLWEASNEVHTVGATGSTDAAAKHADPAYRAEDASQILLRKNFDATGSWIAADRPLALDLLGFDSQLVFDTFASHKAIWTAQTDPALGVTLAEAQRRAMLDWCRVDPRLLPVVVVPFGDRSAAVRLTREALDAGAAAIQISQYCPPSFSPSHIDFEPVWATCAEAQVPIVIHVAGAGGQVMPTGYFENGLPPVPDFHGGDSNFKSIDYLSIPYPVMQTLSALIIDGVLLRHPMLKVGCIEVGASWLPGLMRNLDAAHNAFRKNEERLQRMDMLPSEYIRRQVRVAPYPHEDTGWIISQGGDEVALFSSDFPHVEGGRNPIARFERSMDAHAITDHQKQRFYVDNFVDLLGPQLNTRLG